MHAAFAVSAAPSRRSNQKNNGMPTTPSGLSIEDTTPDTRREVPQFGLQFSKVHPCPHSSRASRQPRQQDAHASE